MRPDRQEAVTWTQMVSIWQVIGRLVRGGSPAHMFFCDGAFFRMKAEDNPKPVGSLLVEMRRVLSPFFDLSSSKSEYERLLVKTLYGPLFAALKKMKGIPEDV